MEDIYRDAKWADRIAEIAEERIRDSMEFGDIIRPSAAIKMAIEEIFEFEYKYTTLSVWHNEKDAYDLLNKRLSNTL